MVLIDLKGGGVLCVFLMLVLFENNSGKKKITKPSAGTRVKYIPFLATHNMFRWNMNSLPHISVQQNHFSNNAFYPFLYVFHRGMKPNTGIKWIIPIKI